MDPPAIPVIPVEVPQTPPPIQNVVCPAMPPRRRRVFTDNELQNIRDIARELDLDNPDS